MERIHSSLKIGRDMIGESSNLAEREGFEPSIPVTQYTRFPSALLQPLGHLSAQGFLSATSEQNPLACYGALTALFTPIASP